MATRRVPTTAQTIRRRVPVARMPRAQQRRLDELIIKSKGDGLTDPEMRELEHLLDEVDRQSFWMLAKRFMPRPVETTKKPARRAAG